ncbi:D-aminoacyl-tRNA deacylase [Sulfurisphaera ohwakuensis]|uniref:D-aminoacyl-tRNA deacylase n=1 Tax=Sulfurisphaera ohwakuensis TaxID=69656 RepID=A0A650CIR4_SULOH|nr:D-aminoacyl-tRNA deacylase [Sulfurisphaera ohwakuensis]MBB5253439.1 D-aminoacyl-tRNA deacylase [Sulfurisphaera ohwakuensis]QGR17754.1 D-aminoacyl-tRNA deacylase [Sulfurisphaera ohwakuensis]
MDIRIIYSMQDAVGKTIKELGYKFEEINEDIIDFRYQKGDVIVVFSRHESSSKIPSLTVHYPGNPTDKTMGGEPKKLGIAFPSLLTSIYREIRKINTDIEKAIEATHHGPTYQHVPIIFVEIGSSKEYWENKELVKTLIEAALRGIDKYKEIECENKIVGFGGTHYTPYFSLLAEKSCVGHIISKYYLAELSNEVILQTVNNTIEKIDTVMFDNVNSKIREKIVNLLATYKLNFKFR